MAQPKESVVSGPHCMVNFAASLLYVAAWKRMARGPLRKHGHHLRHRVPQGVGVSAQEACGVHRLQCKARGRENLLPKGIQPLGFHILGCGREGALVYFGRGGPHHQTLRSGVLGEKVRVPRGRMVLVGNLSVDRHPCAELIEGEQRL